MEQESFHQDESGDKKHVLGRTGRLSDLSLVTPEKSQVTETKVAMKHWTFGHSKKAGLNALGGLNVPPRPRLFDSPLITVTKQCHFSEQVVSF